MQLLIGPRTNIPVQKKICAPCPGAIMQGVVKVWCDCHQQIFQNPSFLCGIVEMQSLMRYRERVFDLVTQLLPVKISHIVLKREFILTPPFIQEGTIRIDAWNDVPLDICRYEIREPFFKKAKQVVAGQ